MELAQAFSVIVNRCIELMSRMNNDLTAKQETRLTL